MKRIFIFLAASVALLVLGMSVCIPGICGCVTSIPGLDGDRVFIPAIACDLFGLLGIFGSVIAMFVAGIARSIRKERVRLTVSEHVRSQY